MVYVGVLDVSVMVTYFVLPTCEVLEESEKSLKCSKKIYDFGKGGLQFSQKFNGYNNYFKYVTPVCDKIYMDLYDPNQSYDFKSNCFCQFYFH